MFRKIRKFIESLLVPDLVWCEICDGIIVEGKCGCK